MGETEMSLQLQEYANTCEGLDAYCIRAFADALEAIPYTLSENSGLHPIKTVTTLRKRHAEGVQYAGINVKKRNIETFYSKDSNAWAKGAPIQPLLVSTSAISLATECVKMLLKI